MHRRWVAIICIAGLIGAHGGIGHESVDDAARIRAALRDFHDAAAKADEKRYFDRFAPEAVFLGTDATERWTLDEFRAFAHPYFQRDSAWTFEPEVQNVTLLPGSEVAFFDEVLKSASYGVCRGSGAVRRIDGVWRISQYNLSVPIPNDLLPSIVTMIAANEASAPVTRVFVLRHFEKDDGADPGLTARGRERARRLARLLARVPIDRVLTTPTRRTRESVAEVARAAGVAVETYAAGTESSLAQSLLRDPGRTTLVAAHSNTVGKIIASLGASKTPIELGESDYGDLFCVTVSAGNTDLLRLFVE